MSNVLTGQAISATFTQLLHMGGTLNATEAPVRSGSGVASFLQLGTISARLGNIRFTSNTITTTNTNGDLTIAPNGTGSVIIPNVEITGGTIDGLDAPLAIASGGTGAATASQARTNLGLGTMAVQNASNVNITGGTISGVSFTGAMTLSTVTVTSSAQIANVGISGNQVTAVGTNASLELTGTGTGQVLFRKKAGYSQGVGLGSSVTQLTSKTTAVTCNTLVGDITTVNSALATGASATFQVNNSSVLATDIIIINHVSGGTVGAYRVMVDRVRAGSFDITITNDNGGGPLSEAIVIRFLVLHGTIT